MYGSSFWRPADRYPSSAEASGAGGLALLPATSAVQHSKHPEQVPALDPVDDAERGDRPVPLVRAGDRPAEGEAGLGHPLHGVHDRLGLAARPLGRALEVIERPGAPVEPHAGSGQALTGRQAEAAPQLVGGHELPDALPARRPPVVLLELLQQAGVGGEDPLDLLVDRVPVGAGRHGPMVLGPSSVPQSLRDHRTAPGSDPRGSVERSSCVGRTSVVGTSCARARNVLERPGMRFTGPGRISFHHRMIGEAAGRV